MKSLAIQSILAGIILIAGIFAFMPIDSATTVHDNIIASIIDASSDAVEDERANSILDVPASIPDGTIIILYDGLGNDKDGDLEFNGNVETGTEWTLEYRDNLAGAWTLVDFDTTSGSQTAGSSPTGVDHFDRTTQGLRLVCVHSSGDADECDVGTFVSVSLVGVT